MPMNAWSPVTLAALTMPAADAVLAVAWRTDAAVMDGAVLHAAEQVRAARLPAGKGAAWAQARAGLRTVLGHVTGRVAAELDFTTTPNGKPGLAGIEFNLSHSGAWAVLAVATRPVGIDIETRLVRDPLALAERFCTPHETATLRALPTSDHPAAFRRIWTAREAAVKALGRSLLDSLALFRVEPECGRCVAERPEGAVFTELALLPLPDLEGAAVTLATSAADAVVRCVRIV